MTVFNLGSINADLFYRVPHLPGPGETLASTDHSRGLGGKGANMSVAIARAAARAVHIGAVGSDGRWAVERLLEYGVDTRHIARLGAATGHAIIMVDAEGENAIVLFQGANRAIADELVVTEATVKSHLVHIYDKLDVDSRTAAVAALYAMRHRGVPAEKAWSDVADTRCTLATASGR